MTNPSDDRREYVSDGENDLVAYDDAGIPIQPIVKQVRSTGIVYISDGSGGWVEWKDFLSMLQSAAPSP